MNHWGVKYFIKKIPISKLPWLPWAFVCHRPPIGTSHPTQIDCHTVSSSESGGFFFRNSDLSMQISRRKQPQTPSCVAGRSGKSKSTVIHGEYEFEVSQIRLRTNTTTREYFLLLKKINSTYCFGDHDIHNHTNCNSHCYIQQDLK